MLQLGKLVQDKVTTFQGVAVAEVDFMFGCRQFGVVPRINEDGETKEAQFFDEGRLDVVGDCVDGGIPKWTNEIKLGNEVQDKVTGFKGIAIARVRHLHGNIRFGVSPKAKGGAMGDIEYFDEGRLKVIGDGIAPTEVQAERRGGISRDLPKGLR